VRLPVWPLNLVGFRVSDGTSPAAARTLATRLIAPTVATRVSRHFIRYHPEETASARFRPKRPPTNGSTRITMQQFQEFSAIVNSEAWRWS
jgi:hypothetical protein